MRPSNKCKAVIIALCHKARLSQHSEIIVTCRIADRRASLRQRTGIHEDDRELSTKSVIREDSVLAAATDRLSCGYDMIVMQNKQAVSCSSPVQVCPGHVSPCKCEEKELGN